MATRTPGGANEICHIGFNQEQDCFAVGTQGGFRIYNTIPFRGQFVRGKQPRLNVNFRPPKRLTGCPIGPFLDTAFIWP